MTCLNQAVQKDCDSHLAGTLSGWQLLLACFDEVSCHAVSTYGEATWQGIEGSLWPTNHQ